MEQNNNGIEKSYWKRVFATFTAGQALSLIGSSAVQFALIWWLATESGSAIVLSISGLAAFLPTILIGPFAGVWVDRLKLKHTIIYADAFMGVCAAVLAGLFYLGQGSYLLVYAALFLRGLGGAFHMPAVQKAIPMIAPQDQLMRVNGVMQFLHSGAFMLGPVIGAAMYAALPLWLILLTDTLGALLACVATGAIAIPDPPRQHVETPHMWREMKAGAKTLYSMRRMFIVTVTSILCMVAFMPMSSLYPLMTSDYFKGTAWHAGIVEFVFAAGMMAAAALVSARGEVKDKFRMIHLSLLLLGLTSLLCGILPPDMRYFWAFAVVCAFMGASGNLYNIPYMAYMQQNVPPEEMGRVFSLIMSLSSLAMPLGLLIAGPVSEAKGVAFWFLVSGIFMMAVTLLSMVLTAGMKEKAAE